jgi:hypothetical protein
MNRRLATKLSGLSLFALGLGSRLSSAESFEVTKTDEEWRKILTPELVEGAPQGNIQLRRLRAATLCVRDQV